MNDDKEYAVDVSIVARDEDELETVLDIITGCNHDRLTVKIGLIYEYDYMEPENE